MLCRAEGKEGAIEHVVGRMASIELDFVHARSDAAENAVGTIREAREKRDLAQQRARGEQREAIRVQARRRALRRQQAGKRVAEVDEEGIAGAVSEARVVCAEAIHVDAYESIARLGMRCGKLLYMSEEAGARFESGEGIALTGRRPQRVR